MTTPTVPPTPFCCCKPATATDAGTGGFTPHAYRAYLKETWPDWSYRHNENVPPQVDSCYMIGICLPCIHVPSVHFDTSFEPCMWWTCVIGTCCCYPTTACPAFARLWQMVMQGQVSAWSATVSTASQRNMRSPSTHRQCWDMHLQLLPVKA